MTSTSNPSSLPASQGILLPSKSGDLDQNMVEAIQGYRTPQLDTLSNLLHALVTDEFIVFSVPFVAWAVDPKVGALFSLILGLSELFNGLIKWIVQRPRPFWTSAKIKNVGGKWEQDYSFPSSHAQTSATAVAFLYLAPTAHPILKYIAAVLALLAGCSRVYRGVHFPSCVVAGWVIGAAFTAAFHYVDPVQWFSETLDTREQYIVLAIVTVVPTFILAFARGLVPPPAPAVVSKWNEIAHKNTKGKASNSKSLLLEPRRITKYTLQLASVPGGVLGSIFAINRLVAFKIRYLREICDAIPWDRVVLGYAGLVLLGAVAFVLASRIRSPSTQLLVKVIAFALVGFWSAFGCPFSSYMLFGQECPILTVRALPNASARDMDVCSGSASYLAPKRQNVLQVCSVNHAAQLVSAARDNGYKLRVIGASHSPQVDADKALGLHPPAAEQCGVPQPAPRVATAVMISLTQHFDYLQIHQPAVSGGKAIATIGAGIFLGRSAGVPSLQLEDTLLYKLYLAGYALPNTPGINGLTLGGLIQTGSEGDAARYSLYDSILGFRAVDGHGKKIEAWRNATDPKQRDLFFGGLVSFGLTGIAYEYIIELDPLFCVENLDTKLKREIALSDSYTFLNMSDYNRVFISRFSANKKPLAQIGAMKRRFDIKDASTCDNAFGNHLPYYPIQGEHYAVAKLLLNFAFCAGDYRSASRDLATSGFAQKQMEVARHSRRDSIAVEWCIRSINDDRRETLAIEREGPTREQMQACLGRILDDPPSRDVIKPMHRMIPREQGVSEGVEMHLEFAEIMIPTDKNDIRRMFQLLEEFDVGAGWSATRELVSYEVYSAKQLPFWMIASNAGPVVRIGQFSWGTEVSGTYFKQLWSHFYQNGVRFSFHVGKFGPWMIGTNAYDENLLKMHQEQFPKLNDFRKLVLEHDPNGVFRTEIWETFLKS